MKIIFADAYTNACGIRSVEYHEGCKVRCHKDSILGIDSAEILHNGEVIGSFCNKIIKEIVLED